MSSGRKVIFFVTSLQSGGIENYLLRFLKEKHSNIADITVFCKGGFGGQLEAEYLKIDNIRIVKKKVGYFDPFVYLYLYRFLKKGGYTTVCDFTGNFAGLMLAIASVVGIKKRIAFYRGSSDHFRTSAVKRAYNSWVKSLVYKYATDILSNSISALNYFFPNKWNDDGRFEVIYNGINATVFVEEKKKLRDEFGIPHNAFVVGHTGRYNVAKNHKTIMAVAEQLVNEYEDIYFILCGNGVEQNLLSVLQMKKIDQRILVFENRTDIPRFLNTMDCYYFPSLTEGQPNALIEAMVMDIPVVASNIEPVKETLPEKLHGNLVEPLDVLSAKRSILEVYTNRRSQELSSWAINKFDASTLFSKFYNKI